MRENEFVIEDGVLLAYTGNATEVIVPSGVRQIGGEIGDKDVPEELRGDLIGYKAFFCNETIEDIYLPSSVETIGFKAMEHCCNLKTMSFSKNLKTFGTNSLLGVELEAILYRGTMDEFKSIEYLGGAKVKKVICRDGVIDFTQE